MSQRKIRVLPTPEAVAEECAAIITDAAYRAIAQRDTFTLALAGGSTPKALYELLAAPPYASRIRWAQVEVFFGDERCVPPAHADSNFRMASEALLDQVDIPPANIHRMRGEIEPEAAAIEYGQLLKSRFDDGGVDLAILGMGEDGHTASLFPHTKALTETHHRCVANYVEKLNAWRITMSAVFLNRSAQVAVLVTGAAKAPRVQEVFEGEPDPQRLPIQLIDPPAGQMIWLMDAAAVGMA